MTLSDSNRNCEARTTVTLGKPPWRGLGSSTGATHSYYQIVLQSSIATLRAYDGNFTDIGTPTFSYPSATEVEIDVPIADMGLSQDKLSLGFASHCRYGPLAGQTVTRLCLELVWQSGLLRPVSQLLGVSLHGLESLAVV